MSNDKSNTQSLRRTTIEERLRLKEKEYSKILVEIRLSKKRLSWLMTIILTVTSFTGALLTTSQLFDFPPQKAFLGDASAHYLVAIITSLISGVAGFVAGRSKR
ncbi:MAG: hypothetical protein JO295_11395 [Verrucomicrobia bacterium]|nr:hypothetical protein [Verrucomicrobiota bacterium]